MRKSMTKTSGTIASRHLKATAENGDSTAHKNRLLQNLEETKKRTKSYSPMQMKFKRQQRKEVFVC